MNYELYLMLYDLADTKDSREDWLHKEWSRGNLYKEGGKFFSVETGEEVK